jgi:CheY-like chemotaxis protein
MIWGSSEALRILGIQIPDSVFPLAVLQQIVPNFDEFLRDFEDCMKHNWEYVGTGETILVVDDMPEQRELAGRMLTRLGYQVCTVAGGEAALHFLTEKPVDLVILDMIMDPGVDGLETYSRILAANQNQWTIIVSGFSETDQVTEVLRLGARSYVRKP